MEAILSLDPAYAAAPKPAEPATFEELLKRIPQFSRAEVSKVHELVSKIGSSLAAIDTLTQAIKEYADADLTVEAANDRVKEAEQRLAGIGTSVRAKMEHMAHVLKEEERISAELLTRKRELAVVDAEMEKYRAAIAAL